MILGIIAVVVNGLIWGFATQKVIENKGYEENWFWWGFFFGLIALIVACTKSERVRVESYSSRSFYNNGTGSTHEERILNEGGWKCSCGKVQASYVSSCSCGRNRHELARAQYEREQEAARKQAEADAQSKAAAIREYKALVDSGVITQEEFEAKKKQLLGI